MKKLCGCCGVGDEREDYDAQQLAASKKSIFATHVKGVASAADLEDAAIAASTMAKCHRKYASLPLFSLYNLARITTNPLWALGLRYDSNAQEADFVVYFYSHTRNIPRLLCLIMCVLTIGTVLLWTGSLPLGFLIMDVIPAVLWGVSGLSIWFLMWRYGEILSDASSMITRQRIGTTTNTNTSEHVVAPEQQHSTNGAAVVDFGRSSNNNNNDVSAGGREELMTSNPLISLAHGNSSNVSASSTAMVIQQQSEERRRRAMLEEDREATPRTTAGALPIEGPDASPGGSLNMMIANPTLSSSSSSSSLSTLTMIIDAMRHNASYHERVVFVTIVCGVVLSTLLNSTQNTCDSYDIRRRRVDCKEAVNSEGVVVYLFMMSVFLTPVRCAFQLPLLAVWGFVFLGAVHLFVDILYETYWKSELSIVLVEVVVACGTLILRERLSRRSFDGYVERQRRARHVELVRKERLWMMNQGIPIERDELERMLAGGGGGGGGGGGDTNSCGYRRRTSEGSSMTTDNTTRQAGGRGGREGLSTPVSVFSITSASASTNRPRYCIPWSPIKVLGNYSASPGKSQQQQNGQTLVVICIGIAGLKQWSCHRSPCDVAELLRHIVSTLDDCKEDLKTRTSPSESSSPNPTTAGDGVEGDRQLVKVHCEGDTYVLAFHYPAQRQDGNVNGGGNNTMETNQNRRRRANSQDEGVVAGGGGGEIHRTQQQGGTVLNPFAIVKASTTSHVQPQGLQEEEGVPSTLSVATGGCVNNPQQGGHLSITGDVGSAGLQHVGLNSSGFVSTSSATRFMHSQREQISETSASNIAFHHRSSAASGASNLPLTSTSGSPLIEFFVRLSRVLQRATRTLRRFLDENNALVARSGPFRITPASRVETRNSHRKLGVDGVIAMVAGVSVGRAQGIFLRSSKNVILNGSAYDEARRALEEAHAEVLTRAAWLLRGNAAAPPSIPPTSSSSSAAARSPSQRLGGKKHVSSRHHRGAMTKPTSESFVFNATLCFSRRAVIGALEWSPSSSPSRRTGGVNADGNAGGTGAGTSVNSASSVTNSATCSTNEGSLLERCLANLITAGDGRGGSGDGGDDGSNAGGASSATSTVTPTTATSITRSSQEQQQQNTNSPTATNAPCPSCWFDIPRLHQDAVNSSSRNAPLPGRSNGRSGDRLRYENARDGTILLLLSNRQSDNNNDITPLVPQNDARSATVTRSKNEETLDDSNNSFTVAAAGKRGRGDSVVSIVQQEPAEPPSASLRTHYTVPDVATETSVTGGAVVDEEAPASSLLSPRNEILSTAIHHSSWTLASRFEDAMVEAAYQRHRDEADASPAILWSAIAAILSFSSLVGILGVYSSSWSLSSSRDSLLWIVIGCVPCVLIIFLVTLSNRFTPPILFRRLSILNGMQLRMGMCFLLSIWTSVCYLTAVFVAPSGTVLGDSQVIFLFVVLNWSLIRPSWLNPLLMWFVTDVPSCIAFILRTVSRFDMLPTSRQSLIAIEVSAIICMYIIRMLLAEAHRHAFAVEFERERLNEALERDYEHLETLMRMIMPSDAVAAMVIANARRVWEEKRKPSSTARRNRPEEDHHHHQHLDDEDVVEDDGAEDEASVWDPSLYYDAVFAAGEEDQQQQDNLVSGAAAAAAPVILLPLDGEKPRAIPHPIHSTSWCSSIWETPLLFVRLNGGERSSSVNNNRFIRGGGAAVDAVTELFHRTVAAEAERWQKEATTTSRNSADDTAADCNRNTWPSKARIQVYKATLNEIRFMSLPTIDVHGDREDSEDMRCAALLVFAGQLQRTLQQTFLPSSSSLSATSSNFQHGQQSAFSQQQAISSSDSSPSPPMQLPQTLSSITTSVLSCGPAVSGVLGRASISFDFYGHHVDVAGEILSEASSSAAEAAAARLSSTSSPMSSAGGEGGYTRQAGCVVVTERFLCYAWLPFATTLIHDLVAEMSSMRMKKRRGGVDDARANPTTVAEATVSSSSSRHTKNLTSSSSRVREEHFADQEEEESPALEATRLSQDETYSQQSQLTAATIDNNTNTAEKKHNTANNSNDYSCDNQSKISYVVPDGFFSFVVAATVPSLTPPCSSSSHQQKEEDQRRVVVVDSIGDSIDATAVQRRHLIHQQQPKEWPEEGGGAVTPAVVSVSERYQWKFESVGRVEVRYVQFSYQPTSEM